MPSTTEYKWTVRKNNTGRLLVKYTDPNGAPIDITGAVGTLYVYDAGTTALEVTATNDNANGTFALFLTKAQILAFDFRQAEYEFIVAFPNGDETTLVDGPLIVASGRGPFE